MKMNTTNPALPRPSATLSQRERVRSIAPIAVLAVTAMITASLAGVFTATPVAAPAVQTADAQAQLATIKEYCAGCHSDRVKTAGVSFEGLTAASVGEHAEVFEKAVRKLRGRVMPPPGARQPKPEATDSLIVWLEASLDRAATQAHIPDQVVLHRLNRKEYENAVRDLLSVEVNANELLPADDTAEGFDNIATALQVSPSFIEQYVIAARIVAVKALGRPDARPGYRRSTRPPGAPGLLRRSEFAPHGRLDHRRFTRSTGSGCRPIPGC